MSPIIEFYKNDVKNIDGYKRTDILAFNDDEFEGGHTFIQWMFPLQEPSQFNLDAPLLTEEDIAVWNADDELKKNLLETFDRFLNFIGVGRNGLEMKLNPSESTENMVWKRFNHNMLRITRVLRCLYLLGLKEYSFALYEMLREVYDTKRYRISPTTFQFWTEAVR